MVISCDVAGLNALLCIVIVLTPWSTKFATHRDNTHEDKDTVLDKSEKGDRREAPRHSSCFLFLSSQSINQVLLCNVRADVDCRV